MIEINLIPDVKQEYLKSQQLRARVVSVSILVSLVAMGAIAFLAAYMGTQAVRELIADKSIKDDYAKLMKDNPDLNNIVTIQNQLANITNLNNDKPITSRVLQLLTAINPEAPNDVKMTSVDLDPSTQTLSIEATAQNGFQAADVFKKTILNTKVAYSTDNGDETVSLADTIDLSNVSYGADSTGAKVLRFKLTFMYPKELLSNQVKSVKIESPTTKLDVTDSKIFVPDSLFTQAATDIQEGN